MKSTKDKELERILTSTFNMYYYMLDKHRTWDYIETVKHTLLIELEQYINESKTRESRET